MSSEANWLSTKECTTLIVWIIWRIVDASLCQTLLPVLDSKFKIAEGKVFEFLDLHFFKRFSLVFLHVVASVTPLEAYDEPVFNANQKSNELENIV